MAIEFPTADDAIATAKKIGNRAISTGGKYLVTSQAEIVRLEENHVPFAFLHIHNGRLVTVPSP